MYEIALLQNTERKKNDDATSFKILAKFAMRIFAVNYLTRIPVCHMHSSPTLSVMVTIARPLTWLFEKNIISSPVYITRNFRKPILPSHQDSDHSTVKCYFKSIHKPAFVTFFRLRNCLQRPWYTSNTFGNQLVGPDLIHGLRIRDSHFLGNARPQCVLQNSTCLWPRQSGLHVSQHPTSSLFDPWSRMNQNFLDVFRQVKYFNDQLAMASSTLRTNWLSYRRYRRC